MSNIIHGESYFQVPFAQERRVLTDSEYRLLVELYALGHRYSAAAIQITDAELSRSLPHTDKTIKRAREGLAEKGFIWATKGLHGIYTYVLLNHCTEKPQNERKVQLPREPRKLVGTSQYLEPRMIKPRSPTTNLSAEMKPSVPRESSSFTATCHACSRNNRAPAWQMRPDGSSFCVVCHPVIAAPDPGFRPPTVAELGFTASKVGTPPRLLDILSPSISRKRA